MNTIDKLKFIKSAIADPRDRRPTVEKAYYDAEASRLVSTDGRAMHWWSMSAAERKELGIAAKQESSHVDILIKGKEFTVSMASVDYGGDRKFPNYQQIIPEYGMNKEVDYKLAVSRHKTMDMPRFLVTLSIPIDLKYLEPFWAFKSSEWSVVRAPTEDYRRRPVLFRGEDLAAGVWGVVMPFNLE